MPSLVGMTICFVAGTLGQGGSERQLYYMLDALRKEGARPRVLSLTRGDFWESRIRELGIPVEWVGQSRSRIRRLHRIIAALRDDPPDVLQSQHFYTNLYVTASARLLGLREVAALRSNGISELGASHRVFGRMSLRAPRAIAANSRAAIENTVARGVPRSRLHFLPNVVDTEQFSLVPRSRNGTVRILTVGRMVQVKRFDRFISMFADVRRRAQLPVSGVIVGDGPLRPQLESQANELALLPHGLEFHGSAANVAPLYQDADILVLTSDWEGTPNVVLEAMASGLPVVATRVGGLPDLVCEGETGYLIEPSDEASLSNAVLTLVEDPCKRETFGRRAREFVEKNHAYPRLSQELRNLYAAILERQCV